MFTVQTSRHVQYKAHFALLVLVILFAASFQQAAFCKDVAWGATEIPNPQGAGRDQCGRGGKKSAVCDPDGFISPSDADTIDGLINFIHDGSHGFHQYPCPGGTLGAQISVAIVSRMKRSPGDDSDKRNRALSFAKTLHDRWGVGDRACQNGAVLFFAISDRAMGFSTGAGLKSVVTDKHVSAIMDTIGDDLRREKYGHAVIKAVSDIGNILSGNIPHDLQNYNGGNSGGGFGFGLFALAAVGMIGVSSVNQGRSRRRYKRCKQVLKTIDRDRARANRQEYVATSCPICLEDFSNEQQSSPRTRSSSNMREDIQSARDTVIEMAPLQASNRSSQHAPNDDSGQQVATLACGHKFHRSCVLQWASSGSGRNTTCPVCRRPIVEEGEGDIRNGLTRENAGSRRSTAGWDLYDDEYNFRLRRAHYFYPDFVTWAMIDDWSRHRRDESHPLASSNAFSAVDPAVVTADARHAGSSGTSFSFGGGSSVGGGGGGGSW